MEQEKELVKYGKDPFTVSINANEKSKDWHCDYNCKIVLGDGQVLWANLYKKNDTWIAGKIKDPLDDKIPF